MDSKQQFEEWHIDNSIDHYKPYKDQLFAAWQAGRASMRDEAAKECCRMKMYPGARQESAAHGNVWDAAKAIKEIQP